MLVAAVVAAVAAADMAGCKLVVWARAFDLAFVGIEGMVGGVMLDTLAWDEGEFAVVAEAELVGFRLQLLRQVLRCRRGP